jgi:hypothetical protein
MDRCELDGADWTIPAARVKGKHDMLIPLSKKARAVLDSVPVIGSAGKGPVFTNDGKTPISGFGKAKVAFDKAVAKMCAEAGTTALRAGPSTTCGELRAHCLHAPALTPTMPSAVLAMRSKASAGPMTGMTSAAKRQ